MTGLLLRGTWYYSRVPRTGLEPATLCLEGRCSIQLSYRGIKVKLNGE